MAACYLDVKDLLGQNPSSDAVSAHITSLVTLIPSSTPVHPEVKAYPDAVYFNYYPLGLSLQFKPIDGYKPKTGLRHEELKQECLVLDTVDIFNESKPQPGATVAKKTKSVYDPYPTIPFTLTLASIPGKERPTSLSINAGTSGKEFVECLGEPDRKGGGAGPSSGSIGIWCEWAKDGVMVEFGGEESRGPQAWERGKDASWKVISIFRP